MSVIDARRREVVLKIVYYGPGLSGKTTSLKAIHGGIPQEKRPEMISLKTKEDRTLYFDFLPMELGKFQGFTVRLQLFTVPGQVFYESTRKMVLNGAAGVVFVADSQEPCRARNLESMEDLRKLLKEYEHDLAEFPHVLQYNKRDLPNLIPVQDLNRDLNLHDAPYFETVADSGDGIRDALREITRQTLEQLKRRHEAHRRNISDEYRAVAAALDEEEGEMGKALAAQLEAAHNLPSPTLPPEAGGGVSFADCWSELELSAHARAVEDLLARDCYADSVLKSAQLVSRIAELAGLGPERDATLCTLRDISEARYQRYNELVSRALKGHDISAVDAHFVYHVVVQLALCDDAG